MWSINEYQVLDKSSADLCTMRLVATKSSQYPHSCWWRAYLVLCCAWVVVMSTCRYVNVVRIVNESSVVCYFRLLEIRMPTKFFFFHVPAALLAHHMLDPTCFFATAFQHDKHHHHPSISWQQRKPA